jgi:hypothetical protein
VPVPGEKPESHQKADEAAENEAATEAYSFLKPVWRFHRAFCRLTMELTGRPQAPNQATPAHAVFGAGGAGIQAVHGPVQRLLELAFIEATVRARQKRCNERSHGVLSFPTTLQTARRAQRMR